MYSAVPPVGRRMGCPVRFYQEPVPHRIISPALMLDTTLIVTEVLSGHQKSSRVTAVGNIGSLFGMIEGGGGGVPKRMAVSAFSLFYFQ